MSLALPNLSPAVRLPPIAFVLLLYLASTAPRPLPPRRYVEQKHRSVWPAPFSLVANIWVIVRGLPGLFKGLLNIIEDDEFDAEQSLVRQLRHHFGTFLAYCTPLCRPTLAWWYTIRSACAYWVRIDACF